MKELKYDGILSDDLKTLKSKKNIGKRIIISLIISIAILTGIFSLSTMLFSINTLLAYSIIPASVLISIVDTKLYNKRLNNTAIKSKNNISKLTNSIKKETNSEITNKNIIDSLTEIKSDDEIIMNKQDTKKTTSEETLVNRFYLLDKEDQLQVLEEVRKYIKNQKESSLKYKLYLFDKEDIKNNEIPVVKKLEFKAKKNS